ncbi:hypothetical protein [Nocardiopsis ansamitocini]|uniref:SWIM-type domain-containing protein n=1 Tax=Nocardiopsis ansamitocini TaxID=1670832 RepID=A0A9W6P9H8_9ACTN|nr:hypothetical protein [Nocardiopsis ansamitocini]GLU49453.1 hypothetical protein Nans01_38040 [Nocardiopsis ansamitocini]
MTQPRPRIDPGLLADLLAAAPARVRKKIDADPRAAQSWEWTLDGDSWLVAAGTETVRLGASDITEAGQVGCGCLLSPRCLHLLSVVGLLDSTDPPEPGVDGQPVHPPAPDPAEPSRTGTVDALAEQVEVDEDTRTAARFAWSAGAGALAVGVRAAGAAERVELLRAAGLARVARLPRLAAACTAVAAGPRDFAGPGFALAAYAAELSSLLDVAWRLGGGPEGPRPAATLADVGIGRRAYTRIGSLRLYGLGCERVVTTSGYGGVVSHAVSFEEDAPRFWRIGAVTPGGADRVVPAYGGSVAFGRVSLSHRALTRSGLIAQEVSASADGRLSGGAATTAAPMGGCAWNERPLAVLWERPLADQVGAALAALAAPAHRTGADLVFVDLALTGLLDGGDVGAVEAATGRRLVLSAGTARDHQGVRTLARLAAVPGLRMRVVARPVVDAPGTLMPLTVAPDPAFPLAADWKGLVNISLDDVPGTAAQSAKPEPGVPAHPVRASPFTGVARVLNRVAEAGRDAAPQPGVLPAQLRRHHLPTAAGLLAELTGAARYRLRTTTGESAVPPPDALATAWLAAMTYLDSARSHLDADAWALAGHD